MDLQRVERELINRLSYPYRWGRKQSNSWDHATNFIYKTYSMQKLLILIEPMTQDLKDYAMNRWYNYWSAMAVEDIFSSHSCVKANSNVYDKLVDFKINDIPFDHKTSVFPRGFKHSYEYALEHKKELIEWLYINQSQEGRKHLSNRLFIIMYDRQREEHWKMKSEIMIVKKAIDKYIKNFQSDKLEKVYIGEEEILSDIIWITKGL